MNTRSTTRRTAAVTQNPSDFLEVRPESDVPVVGGLDRSPHLDHSKVGATVAPTAPVSDSGALPPQENLEEVALKSVSRSRMSGSSRSAATIRARRLAAEAHLARQHLEHEKELARKELEIEIERKLFLQQKRFDELEMEANLAQLEAEGSQSSVSDFCQSWVNAQNREKHEALCQNAEQVPEFPPQMPKPSQDLPNVVEPGVQLYIQPSRRKHQTVSSQKAQINTRPTCDVVNRCVSKYVELVPFSGKTTEWFMFIRTYSDTKDLFSPTENLARLRCALRGPALECVSSLLYTAQSPEEVVELLEQTFALPETIVLHEIGLVRSLPKISFDLKDLNSFACRLRNCIAVINSLGQTEYLYSIEIFHTVLSKLTPILYSQWKEFAYRSDRKIPKLQLLSQFLIAEADKHNRFGLIHDFAKGPLGGAADSSKRQGKEHTSHFVRRENIHTSTTRHSNDREVCLYCKKNHKLTDCKGFISLSTDNKWSWLREAKICFKCLKSKAHRWKSCRIGRCGIDGCVRFHHPILHSPAPATTPVGSAGASCQCSISTSLNSDRTITNNPGKVHSGIDKPVINESNRVGTSLDRVVTISNVTCDSNTLVEKSQVFLKVVPVEVSGPKGKYKTFALLDDGSTATLIDSEVARHIGATGPSDSIKVDGIAGMSVHKPIQYVNFSIQGLNCNEIFSVTNAKAIDTLSLYTQTVNKSDISHYIHLTDLVDQLTYVNAKPKVLIGAEHWYLSVSREVREGSKSQPVATRTALGWVLHGKSSGWTKPIYFVNHVSLNDVKDSIDQLIKDYFRLDSIDISKRESLHNENEKRALDILESTAKRLPSGRFQVGLLWRKEIQNIPDSYPHAYSRFLNLERRMAQDPDFKKAYCFFINSMLEKGYAEECPRDTYHDTVNPTSIQHIRWYLPHFAVIHPQKKKLRVVHDAAAKTSGVSLNSLLLPGPDLLQSLLDILFRFREGRIALTADVREMFPQIKIRPEDRDALRFVWRDDHNSEIKEYRMTSVIFGAACSPCTALYIKNINAQELQNLYPAATAAIISDHYMDDFLGSLDNEQEASQLAVDIVTVHKAAGMEMRGWTSNVPAVLANVPQELRAITSDNVSLHIGSEALVRTLGLIWHPQSDVFSFRSGPQISENDSLTKRKVLSKLMCVFDPLGLLTPLIIQGRILFQQTWRSGIDWDTELQPAMTQKWLFWSRQLANISNIKIPRWYRSDFQGKVITERQLHVLADASEEAYACVAYWRFTFDDGSVKLSLIGGKARLAPLKPTSIPRLELQAALIAARFADTVCKGHKVSPKTIYFWTDSTTVLSWLRSDARTFKPFVANRVGEIIEITNVSNWGYVPSGLNVADDATRLRDHTINLKRWFSGPDFLLLPTADWPREPLATVNSPVLEEMKPSKTLVAFTFLDSMHLPEVSRFSEWMRFVCATARVYQYIEKFRSFLVKFQNQNSKLPANINCSAGNILPLTAENMQKAECAILKKSQVDSFSQELVLLHDSKPLPKSSRLFSLYPLLDETGLLRINSRIKHMGNIDYDMVSPIILDGRNSIVRLLIRHYHIKAAHGFNELILNELKHRFWIIGCRNAIKAVSRECRFCKKRKAMPQVPPIGDLPTIRLEHHQRPFTNVGLDYFGPLEVTIGRHREKRYVALFTCLSTRAIHLEMVTSLSADSAISGLRRFIARRGIPSQILSDNGTAFVGANRQLLEFYDEAVENFAASNRIKWCFIPPASPFMGGCWERLVRTVKSALSVTLREKAPKEEVLNTLLLEAEALVNSRPLTYVTRNGECQSLTPFHFILGSSSNQQLPTKLDDGVFSLRKDWQKALRLSEHFWKRWLQEYLPTLRPRRGHGEDHRNLQVGDVVAVVDPDLPRGVWPLGRIVKCYPGADGVVRVADVETVGGTLKRPTRKLALLEEN